MTSIQALLALITLLDGLRPKKALLLSKRHRCTIYSTFQNPISIPRKHLQSVFNLDVVTIYCVKWNHAFDGQWLLIQNMYLSMESTKALHFNNKDAWSQRFGNAHVNIVLYMMLEAVDGLLSKILIKRKYKLKALTVQQSIFKMNYNSCHLIVKTITMDYWFMMDYWANWCYKSSRCTAIDIKFRNFSSLWWSMKEFTWLSICQSVHVTRDTTCKSIWYY